jgi:hypothetical protein
MAYPPVVRVQVGASQPKVTSISYGGRFALKSASDLDFTGAVEGDVIVYKADTNTFVVEPVSAVIPRIDGGQY